ncbi:ribosome-associated translation inhibitor RaiA [Sulfuricurvum sp. IAE1]|jgi:putative sigma-54 modulation protein|uniref:ribosome hibernation-promoting factor, HPF/YfiA family n=1 Tax=Sulfuricurvum sp. IAE1 TaxID=2546102 RepID=UPI0010489F1A|nr:ribosome-associated translation inhibitor RaiA [Sulfuricurvum sp. IAE1]MDD3769118.1 ribosome-associated translation inhibitor RaiA [Sulfuricurvum sp.]MDX9966954.1 ribosome-associated translation inhibitor RaiA [Sulfuricurvum sp.]TDA69606.1 ribosome-associated translation inhibitor RaiA [Sulfuricurvum sp. IAE1]
MNVQIRSKEIKLTQHLNDHIAAAIENFKRYHLDITTVNVMISKEKKGVGVEFDIHIAHAQPVVISDTDEDLDTAIDMAIERANKALRRLHDKVKDHHTSSIRDMEVAETE